MLLAARAAGVGRVIYLGAVGSSEDAPSQHLVARWATELAVRQSELDWAVLRAPLIVGAGSTLFELMRRVVNRSPVVPMFGWRRTEVEPVALADVVLAIRMTLDDPTLSERVLEVCGPERMPFGEVARGWARATGRRRLWLPLPGWGEGVQEHARPGRSPASPAARRACSSKRCARGRSAPTPCYASRSPSARNR